MDLEERLEALAQTVELLARMQVDNERLLREHQAECRERSTRTDQRLAQLMEAITRLTNIDEAHEERLDDIEGRDSAA
jgi:hypothetical protein